MRLVGVGSQELKGVFRRNPTSLMKSQPCWRIHPDVQLWPQYQVPLYKGSHCFATPAIHTYSLLSQVVLTPPEAPNLKSEELNVEPRLGRPLPPEVKVEEPKEELHAAASGEAGFVPEAPRAGREVPPAVVMETAAPLGGLGASTVSSTEIAQPQKGRKPRDLELPLSPSLLGGPGPERTPGSGIGSSLQAPGPALTPSLLPTHTLVSACGGAGLASRTSGIGAGRLLRH